MEQKLWVNFKHFSEFYTLRESLIAFQVLVKRIFKYVA